MRLFNHKDRIAKTLSTLLLATIAATSVANAQTDSKPKLAGELRNIPEREEEFMDWGLGLFVHWSIDSQLGSVISHHMDMASDKHLDRMVNELPKTFNPTDYNPDEWMQLAKLAGVKYMVLTTKHHSGFCLWDSAVTDYDIANTPYKKDIVKEFVDACRRHDIKVGFYYSPEDFAFNYKAGYPARGGKMPKDKHAELVDFTKVQIKELLTNYGPIDVMFLDGGHKAVLTQYCHEVDPNVIVTRGEMVTPEQRLPKNPIPGPWETCFTLGNQWQYKPTNDDFKSGSTLINMLVETRAKGGNLLINVGPKPDGSIPIEQEERFRELALWMFVNDEAIHDVRACVVAGDKGHAYYTQSKDGKYTYAIVTKFTERDPVPNNRIWGRGSRKEFLLPELVANENTTVQVLGQDHRSERYSDRIDLAINFENTKDGLLMDVIRQQRLYNWRNWPNAVVLRFENVDFVQPEEAVEVATDGKEFTSESGITWSSSPVKTKGGKLASGLFDKTGALAYAENTGGPKLTFDGIDFRAGTTASTTVLGVAGPAYAGYAEGEQIISSGMYPAPATAIPELRGLNIGSTYRVQALFYDQRPNQEGQHVIVEGKNMGRYANGPGGNGLLVSGTFVATADTQSFKLERTANDGKTPDNQIQLNALVLHQLP
ncbi:MULTISPECIES: alpha-L-fucosidase [unclassified Lentimonas]|uniref:alpha-L-fucosidase n=1 Tax=unclassified Lentimonas TaxID=2630993 RepID=UPI0013283CC0|nr:MULTISPECIES: alpha-L-fucosidase [unclassified Lentimonas]CAA6692444.1 Alpha-L-fucosidase (EC [Lentimonas sp. CC19]CAA6693492.1 Alpha-L-fucosidase (EC [Lentimonas sp. CC10]CAA7070806.1 Alpha-L-fucosidase (EC [Lentimonas sp. CC11]